MNKTTISIIREICEQRLYELTIPELDLVLKVESPFHTASVLSTMIYDLFDDDDKNKNDNENRFQTKEFNPQIILKAIDVVNSLADKNIAYIGLVGKKNRLAYEMVQKNWSNQIINNEIFKPIMLENEVYFPIEKNTFSSRDLETLSSIGVTVSRIGYGFSSVFSDGKEMEYSYTDIASFIHYVNVFGFFYDEFVLAEILAFIIKKEPKYQSLLLENLNTNFIKSLPHSFDGQRFNYIRNVNNIDRRDNLAVLLEIMNNLDFKIIKDYSFEFVKVFLYEPTKS